MKSMLKITGFFIFVLLFELFSMSVSAQKKHHKSKTLIGKASFYHKRFNGRLTATGERFSGKDFTAASNHFKLPTYAKVTNLKNGRFIYVKINDRMGQPHRIIDLTKRAAKALGFVYHGLAKVRIEAVPKKIGKMMIKMQKENKVFLLNCH